MKHDWSTLKKLIWLKRAVLSAASAILKTITGQAPLLLGNAVAHPIHSLTQYGKCMQSDTPTPAAPVDIVCNNGALKCSANMANVNEQTVSVGYYISPQGVVREDTNNWMYQTYIRVSPSTTYTLSMSSPVYYVTISEYSTADDSGFIIRKNGTTGANTSLTITTGANTNFIRFGTNLNRVVVTLDMVLAIDWMLNLGGTAMDYQPYVEGGIYTDGTPEVLTVGGANLFNAADAKDDGKYINSINGNLGTPSATGGTFVHSDFIPVEAGETYFIGVTSFRASQAGVAFYSDVESASSFTYLYGENGTWLGNNNQTVTAPAGAKYMRFSVRTDSDYDTNWQNTVYLCKVVNGTPTINQFQPYHAPQTASVQTLWGVGDYEDTQEIISGHVKRDTLLRILTGNESWTVSSSYKQADTSVFYYTLPEAESISFVTTQVYLMSTHFPGASRNTLRDSDTACIAFTGNVSKNALTVRIPDTLATTAAGFEAWLAAQYAAGTPVIVLCPLATETTEQTTAQHLHTHEGTNIVDVTSNVDPVELAAEYYATE